MITLGPINKHVSRNKRGLMMNKDTQAQSEAPSDWELLLTVDVRLSWWCEERQHTVQRRIENMVMNTRC